MTEQAKQLEQFTIDGKYSTRHLVKCGGRLHYSRPSSKYGAVKFSPHWIMFVHVPHDNGDGGVLYDFVRSRRKWICVGVGRMRHVGGPGRQVFADKLPDFPERQVVRRDGKWWIADKSSGEIISEYAN